MRPPATLPRLVGGGALALLLLTWWGSGSFLLALLLVVLVGATAVGAWLAVSWSGRSTRGASGSLTGPLAGVADALPTTDLGPASTGDRVRRALRGVLGRPWVHGDGLVRAAARRLASEEALVWTPRGQRVTAPHLWVELHPDDLADVAARWPLEVLADELLSGYLEHARSTEARRMAERTFLHLLAGPDVPVGRVIVTAAFSRPAATPAATTSATDPTPSSVSAPPVPAGPPSPPGLPGPVVPGAAGRPGPALPRPPARPPRPAPARGSAGAPRDFVGGSRGDGAQRSSTIGRGDGAQRSSTIGRGDGRGHGPRTVVHRRTDATVTAPTAPDTARVGTQVATQVRARPTLVDRVVATARGTGRPGVSWRRPAEPRRSRGE
ncbi:hypothetical protein EV188_11311 [Actinomycetospora succinea]|uniref:Uncharacterized protein n=1 Tax=Actinomycetospora succinea TaxID=663603 RepID=A0A4R6UM54_9PSEU|nr:hypothetical protein [Actinomycetospora succinea]TDQ47266.1 hypothetical protein EV188_11311 [Actinomycetospora succinea]